MRDAQKLRLFFAVDLDETLVKKIVRASQDIRNFFDVDTALRRRKWSWVAEENFHLTVKFLGAAPRERVPEILAWARNALSHVSPFEIQIEGAAAFPRVLWLNVRDASQGLSRIAGALDVSLEPLGFERETRPYVPHLTLARLKEGKPSQAATDLRKEWTERSIGTSSVREVILYQSETRPSGAVYRPVDRIALHSSLDSNPDS